MFSGGPFQMVCIRKEGQDPPNYNAKISPDLFCFSLYGEMTTTWLKFYKYKTGGRDGLDYKSHGL